MVTIFLDLDFFFFFSFIWALFFVTLCFDELFAQLSASQLSSSVTSGSGLWVYFAFAGKTLSLNCHVTDPVVLIG